MSCSKMEELTFAARIAEIEAEQRHYARRLFLESHSPSSDVDDHLLTFIEEWVVEAEMKRTRTCISLDEHARSCVSCSPANSN